jgi:hypothetical protein
MMKYHAFIGIPAYDSKINVDTMQALMANIDVLRSNDVEVTIAVVEGKCHVSESRNELAARFMETSCTDLNFVDTDIVFPPGSILQLFRHNVGVVSGLYPLKNHVKGDHFPFWPKLNGDDDRLTFDSQTGLIPLDAGPLGFSRIQRHVIEAMISAHPEWKTSGKTAKGNSIYSLFDTGMVFPGDNNWYTEDYVFCKRWTAMQGQIWGEPRIEFGHIGRNAVFGRLANGIENYPFNKEKKCIPNAEATEKVGARAEGGNK